MVLVILSFTGVVLVLLSTSQYGVGISYDSTMYISAARSLLSGKGYSIFTGGLFVGWPPLFPTLLAALGLIGIEPLDGARFLNAFVFGLIIFTSGQLFRRHIRSKELVMLGTASILLSFPLLHVSIMAWSEPLFILFAVLFILSLSRYLNEKTPMLLFLLSFFAALGCLQRYVGLTLVLTGCTAIVFSLPEVALLKRVKYAMIFSLIATAPVVAWAIRNYTLTSFFLGSRIDKVWEYTFYQNIVSILNILSAWFVPYKNPFLLKLIIIGLIIVAMAAIFFPRLKLNRQVNSGLMRVLPAGVFVLIYVLLLLIVEGINPRYLVPIYVFVMFLIFVGIENISNLLKQFLRNERLGNFIAIGLCIPWLIYPLGRIPENVLAWTQTGAGGYSTVTWAESPTIEWLRTHPLKGRIYSNAPDGIYCLTGIIAKMSPVKFKDILKFRKSMSLRDKNYLVWFTSRARGHPFYNLEELASILGIEEVATFSDGGIYLFK